MTSKKTAFGKLLKWLLITFSALIVTAVLAGYLLIDQLSNELPDIKALRNIQYQIPLSIYSNDGLLIARFGEQKRIPVAIASVPPKLIQAYIAAEDDRFYDHPGVDYKGLFRAAYQLALTGEKKQGGSTITMQVIRNFLLTREKTFTRKIKEIILSLKIEQEFSKNEILELYLNKIYLGHRAYGVAAAAEVYYGKTLSELTLAEQAMLAGLPKAPSKYNPITNPDKALQRRNYALGRMLALNYITEQEFTEASSQAVTASLHSQPTELDAPYIAEMVRNEVYDLYGDDTYTTGLKVYTSIDSQLQNTAIRALRNTLHEYDQRHGYRKQSVLHNKSQVDLDTLKTVGDTVPARVEKISQNTLVARLKDESVVTVPWTNIKWARSYISTNALGPSLKSASSIFSVGDIIRIRKLDNDSWALAQNPEVEGALVSLNPENGAILALTGGYDFRKSKYNRAIQSKRQPGSGFKPIIYTAALEEGFTAASIINDAPIVVDNPNLESEWRPENYSHKFFGPTRLRKALAKSRNLVSIRLLRKTGIQKTRSTAKRWGFTENQLPKSLTLALGSGQASPLQMARVFATFANGGFLIKPYLIERIESNNGDILFQAAPDIACSKCNDRDLEKPGYAPRIISPQVNFLINSMLRDVVQYGTATRAKKLGRMDLAGKTGTTNEQRDAWFNGFTTTSVTTTWVGFDNSDPLGRRETGGTAALPMWLRFMKIALAGTPETSLTIPEGIIDVFIDPETGLLAPPDSKKGIQEYFREEFAPTEYTPVTPDITMERAEDESEEALF